MLDTFDLKAKFLWARVKLPCKDAIPAAAVSAPLWSAAQRCVQEFELGLRRHFQPVTSSKQGPLCHWLEAKAVCTAVPQPVLCVAGVINFIHFYFDICF